MELKFPDIHKLNSYHKYLEIFDFKNAVLLKDPDVRLRQVASDIIFPNDNDLNLLDKLTANLTQLNQYMLKIMRQEEGIGLAATQINMHVRAILIDLNDYTEQTSNINDLFPLFMINPLIIKKSKDLTVLEERCLSVPDKAINIKRPNSLICKYQDITGATKQITVSDLFAKAIQHEIDHLNGKLIIDYL